jgi:acetylornithine deacetylase/succinyl-diaminopimelate desuccinylase-like protein
MKIKIAYLTGVLLFFTFSAVAQATGPDWNKIGDQAVQLFREYLSIDTTNPPGDVSGAVEFYKKVLSDAHVNAEILWTDRNSGRANILARIPGKGQKRPLMLLNHMDTVPIDPEGWSVDAFKGITKDGYIYGRGALDMKNFGIVQLMTMILVQRFQISLERDLVFLAVADEETSGELGAGWIVKNKWDEINAEFVLDEGGFGTQRFFTNDDRLIFSVGVAEKKVLWLRLTVEGTEGHGSMPPADNANFILSQALARVAEFETPIQKTPVVLEMERRIGGLADTPYNNALKRDTISLTVLKGFVGNPPKSNVIPPKAEAILDCRLLPETNPDHFVDTLREVIRDPRVQISFIERPVESITSSFETGLFRTIEEETSKVFPESVVLPHLIIYGTDSRFFRRKGAICYGFFPGPVTMEEYRRIHGNDERIREESFRKAVQIYFNVIKNFCSR